MIPAAQDQNWNCQAAAIASILEVPVESLPAIYPGDHTGESFDQAWDGWLASFGIFLASVNFREGMRPKGYTVGVVQSQKFEGSLHAIVCLDGKPVYDPQEENERPYAADEVETHLLFVATNPAEMVVRVETRGQLDPERA